jgi:CRISPR-associated protein Csm5
MKRPLEIRVTALSPLHIGCDDVYDPTRFVIDEQKKALIEYDPFSFIASLQPAERRDLLQLCEKPFLLDLFKFFKRAYKSSIGGRPVDIAAGLLEQYKKVLALTTRDFKEIRFQVINQFTLNRTAYLPSSGTPYLPGSSLKGVFKTAFLNNLAHTKPHQRFEGRTASKDMERYLLGGAFHTDPFRMVKVADALPGNAAKTRILYGINKKKQPGQREASGPLQIFEAIIPQSTFTGILDVQDPPSGSQLQVTVKTGELLAMTHSFYHALFEEDLKTLQTLGVSNSFSALLKNHQEKLGVSSCLIRIGRHSGAEAVTVERYRSIKIMQGRDRKPDWRNKATTIWLASEYSRPKSNVSLLPFGWALLEVINPQDIEHAARTNDFSRKTI